MSLIDRLFMPPLLVAIRVYQSTLSLLIGQQCRFQPTCSHYMADALKQHGLIRGVALGTRRVCRCHPWHEGGYDPVPTGTDLSGKKRPTRVHAQQFTPEERK